VQSLFGDIQDCRYTPRWVESIGKRWVEVIISDLHSHGIDFTPFLVLVSLRSTTVVLHY
jgi:hypothetical protein